ncbi:EAL domain-containing protein [Cohnella faecalis]|nr:EAL domain-containing protein [Cohnella faecalis]
MFGSEIVFSLLQTIINMIVFILICNRIYPFIIHWSSYRRKVIIGFLFGIASLISLKFPIVAQKGILVNLNDVLAGMSGFLGGPIAGAITFTMAASYRAMLGGIGAVAGIGVMLVAAFIGALLHLYMRGKGFPSMRRLWMPVMFGVIIAIDSFAWTLLFPVRVRLELLHDYAIPFFTLYPLSAVVFYYLMAEEWYSLLHKRNTSLSFQTVQARLERQAAKGRPFSLVVMNIDQFKAVNEMYGFSFGDELLEEVRKRLNALLPEQGWSARINGDEYLLSLPIADRKDALQWLENAKKELTSPYTVKPDGKLVHLSFSTGLALSENNEIPVEELLRQADMALKDAKTRGLNMISPYEQRMTERLKQRTLLEEELRFALERKQLSLHFQPQFELKSGKLKGFEALLRWHHPELGAVSPDEFIPIAEETGLIVPIGQWVLRSACETMQRILPLCPSSTIGVNISALQLIPEQFPDMVLETAMLTGLPLDRLELELTESELMTSLDSAQEQLTRLSEAGVRLALDDFGVGYSSLNYLRKLPFHRVKIDRSFIQDIGTSKDDELAEAIIRLVRQLHLDVVAEGLESYDQLMRLQEWGCDIAQGYLLGRPMPESELHAFIARNTTSFSEA